MKEKIKSLVKNSLEQISDCNSLKELELIKIEILSKNGSFANLMKDLKNIPNEQKPFYGKIINEAKSEVLNVFSTKSSILNEQEQNAKEKKEALDVTLSKKYNIGAFNPINIVKQDISNIFIGMGFSLADGPEIELKKYNFDLLNIPEDHPARDFTDTFYITENLLLRTQTSGVQVRVLEKEKPPIKIICPGKVYRPDDDATHSPMFHQIEGLYIDENVTLKDLKKTLEEFAKLFFDKHTTVRFRPSFFPFTEPSVEVDLSCSMCHGKGCNLCKNTGWLELLGAGVVNPVVLEKSGLDSKKYSGFAFGIGVERAAMIKYGIPDMRLMFDNDVRFIKQFKF
ncbi:MAG: phenylalanine--tRNA ligase subunit alpha [Christensenellales bacterium]|jgi:phenylalanyl-tRNA synthetase alpha chain|nr:phenylalanine--tRNA ligase subunit alpha [Clostridiales bacterium]